MKKIKASTCPTFFIALCIICCFSISSASSGRVGERFRRSYGSVRSRGESQDHSWQTGYNSGRRHRRDRDITCNRNYIGRLNSGVVTSYNYPFDYRNQTRCTHTIFLDQRPANSNRTICFQFQRFEVEATPLCNRDTLQFLWSSNFPNPANSYVNYCGNGTWGYYDETLAISNIFSGELCWPWTSPRFSFVFMSDDYVSNRGFYATYWISDDNATDVPNVTVRKNLFDPTMGPKCKTDPDMCRNHCFHGYEIDLDGCYTCRCLSAYSAPCGQGNYTCFNRMCIPNSKKCNGVNDCGDNSDENYAHARCSGGVTSIEACNFERDECDFTIIGWARGRSSTYGPRYDHTIGELYTGNFMYTTFPSRQSVYMVYHKLPTANASHYCLSFWYFMSGTVGTLMVQVQQSIGVTAPLWIRVDNYGPVWLQGEVEFTSADMPAIQLMFVAKPPEFPNTNIAIDDVSFLPGRCVGDDVSCTFEMGFCGWTAVSTGGATWQRTRGPSSPSNQTGPRSDHPTGTGYYAYVDPSLARVVNQTEASARLISRPLSAFDMKCLIFWYHMYDANHATPAYYHHETGPKFVVRILHYDGSETLAWYRIGSQSSDWLRGVVPLSPVTGPFQIIIEVTASAERGPHIAIDNLVVLDIPCTSSGGLTTTTTTHEPRPLSCRPLEFQCEDGEMCIFLDWQCDGSFHCADKSDERNCGSAPTMSAGVLCAIIISSLTSAALLTFGIAYFYAKRGHRRLCCFRVRSDRWRSRRWAPEGARRSANAYGLPRPLLGGPSPPPYSVALLDNNNRGGNGESPVEIPMSTLTISLSCPTDPPPPYQIAIIAMPISTVNRAASSSNQNQPPSYMDDMLSQQQQQQQQQGQGQGNGANGTPGNSSNSNAAGQQMNASSGSADVGGTALLLHKIAESSL